MPNCEDAIIYLLTQVGVHTRQPGLSSKAGNDKKEGLLRAE